MRSATPDDRLPPKAFERGVWALDLATATGYAYAPPEIVAAWPHDRPCKGGLVKSLPRPPGVVFGTMHLQRSAQGSRFHQFGEWLKKFRPPGLCLIEQPIPGHASRNRAATEIAMGLRTEVHSWAWHAGVEVREVPVVSAKAWFGAPMSKDKEPMIEMARTLGWEAKTDHEADALAVLDYGLAYAALAHRLFDRSGERVA